jgi:ABC-2 type transport system permease protein
MRNILTIALNDVRLTLQERGTLITLFVVPIAMMIVIGSATAGGTARLTLDVVNNADPQDPYVAEFIGLLNARQSDQFAVCLYGEPACSVIAGEDATITAQDRVRDGDANAALIIPANFGESIRSGETVPLTLIGREVGTTAPQLVQQQIDAVLTRMNGSLVAARVLSDLGSDLADDSESFFTTAYQTAESVWASEPVRIEERGNAQFPVNIGGLGQSAPGIAAMFVFLNALNAAQVFIQERRSGTLPRLIIMPIRKWELLAGKLLGRYLLGLLTFVTMIGIATALGVRWGDPLGVVATVLLFTLASTAIGLAFSTLVRSEAQAAGLALLGGMTLAPLGGAWWPLDIVPVWMQTLGRIVSPIAWSQTAFNQMVFYNKTFVDILPALGVLVLFAVVFFTFGVLRFRYE